MKYNANTKSTEKIEHIKNTSFATIETQILMFVNIFFFLNLMIYYILQASIF